MTTTWTLIIVFSWLAPCAHAGFGPAVHCDEVQRSGFTVPGFTTREDCKLAQAAFSYGAKSACVQVQQ